GILWPWLAGIAGCTLLGGLQAMRQANGLVTGVQSIPKPRNPTQLSSALAFAGMFVVIRVATKAAIAYAGMGVFLAVAAASGITDMDAIALSAAREVVEGLLDPSLAARATLLALLSNTLFKLGVARFAGSREVFSAVLPALGGAALVSLAALLFV
ncbi:MAG: hypothetical protein RIS45_1250, partial [Planctomycetota bacterium]